MEDTSKYIKKIRTYDEVSPEMKESLAQFAGYTQDEIDEILEACGLFEELEQQKWIHFDLHATLAGLKVYEHELTGILAGIELTDGPGDNDTSEFLNSSDKYASQ